MAEESNSYSKKSIWYWVLIYLIIGAVIYGVAYYFFFAKNGGYNFSQALNQYKTTKPTGPMKPTGGVVIIPNEMTVGLVAENGSKEYGTATLKEKDGKTTVTLTLIGFEKGVAQPAHIHVGSCPGVGAVKYPLTNAVDGASTTVLDVTLADLKKQLPLAINVHKSATEITNYTACGELK